ncbi:ETX/MTX2 family pore-forming toxin (plasmid) [Bacillus thuringiensis]|uniref:ETX/MTX2 family pore-forming toxin n=1 Tax=Bacillus thuringiensis TaxID=1428 RepID=UPI0039772859
MNKKQFKKPMVALMLATSIGIPCVSAPGSALAAENTPISVNENVKVGITDVQSELKKIGEYYYANEIAGTKIGSWPTLTFRNKPDSVETKVNFSITGTANKLNFDSKIVEYVGENIFENNTDQTQKYSTAKYTKAVTETIATSTVKGFNVGGSSNIFKVPLILNNGLTINAGFNASTTTTQTEATTKTIEASSQAVEVPPKKIYKADVVLEQSNFWGDVTFTGSAQDPKTTIKATASYVSSNSIVQSKKYTFEDLSAVYYKKLTTAQKNNINGLEFISLFPGTTTVLKANGTGRVDGIFGSVLKVKIYDITDKSNPKLVETRSFN